MCAAMLVLCRDTPAVFVRPRQKAVLQRPGFGRRDGSQTIMSDCQRARLEANSMARWPCLQSRKAVSTR